MKKKLTVILFVLVLCFSTMTSVFASDADGFSDEYYRVIDMADLLSESEETALIEELDEISLRQNMDVVVATTDDLQGYSVQDYADLFYEQCNFGYGENKDGLLLLISMEDRDWYISTCGYGITAFTDAGIQYIGEQMTPDLSDADYADAFHTYAILCDDFITKAKDGEPYDNNDLPKEPLSIVWIPISIVIGLVIALIVVSVMIGKLKTVRYQSAANDYVKSGSMNITESRDMFLYRTVNKTARPKNEGSSGGSSTHSSSSGTSHGGGGGKF